MSQGLSQDGYIVISDITGYTAFLSESELEHAQDSLRSLLQVLLEQTKPPLIISRLEGDAVISYAPRGSFLQGHTLVDAIEGTYLVFRQALERMELNTTCTCNACQNIPNLDLKFFVHKGTYALQELGSQVELVGSDVNLVHRLTKNSITETMGINAYALYTQAAVDDLGIGELCGRMSLHNESYEHLGEVTMYVQNMHDVWKRERSRQREVVQPDEAIMSLHHDFPVGPALLWDYLTKPEYRAIALGSDGEMVTGRSDGRTGPGTTYYCAHGLTVSKHSIVDWQPFGQVTYEDAFWRTTSLLTVRLEPIESGTRVTYLCGEARGPQVLRQLAALATRLVGSRPYRNGLRDLHARIDEEIAQGKVVPAASVAVPVDDEPVAARTAP